MKVARPVMRYHGGKWKIAPWIMSHFPEHKIYTESFGGGASVLLRKPRSYAEIYNDLDGEVVNLFRVLRNPNQARELVRLIAMTPYSREEYEESYLADGDPIEQARRSITRSYMSYGSRASNSDMTGFSGSNLGGRARTYAGDWASLPIELSSMIDRLRGVTIEHTDARYVIERYDTSETLHYADPPYPMQTRMGIDVYRHEMTDDDHRELSLVLRNLKGMVVLSGYACELYDRELYPDWQRIAKATHADGARDRTEVLWISPNAITRPQLSLEHKP